MPTGYTADIIDGKINTFPEFAKRCMRAFGAAIHMRDDSLDVQYTPREKSNYHTENLKKVEEDQILLDSISDKDLIKEEKESLQKRKIEIKGYIAKAKLNRDKLDKMSAEVEKWTPPTTEHQGIKTFMLDQLKQTVDHDCNTSYYNTELKEIEEQLASPDAKKIREKKQASIDWSKNYHKSEDEQETKRCKESNQWVSDFLTSLPK